MVASGSSPSTRADQASALASSPGLGGPGGGGVAGAGVGGVALLLGGDEGRCVAGPGGGQRADQGPAQLGVDRQPLNPVDRLAGQQARTRARWSSFRAAEAKARM